MPLAMGNGSGLSPYELGQAGGAENVTITEAQMPAHSHPLQASDAAASATKPLGKVLGRGKAKTFADAPDGTTTMNAASVAPVGGGQVQVSVVQPFLAFAFCIALQGIYPSRD